MFSRCFPSLASREDTFSTMLVILSLAVVPSLLATSNYLAEMKAVIYDSTGKNHMKWVDNHPEPTLPAKNGVLVEVHAVSLNPIDYKLPELAGRFIYGRPASQDFAGVVLKSTSQKFSVGDQVFGFGKSGVLAERILANEDAIAHKPVDMTYVEAAAIPTTYLTSYQVLKGIGCTKGSKVIVAGASGGCGLAGIELARAIVGSEGVVAGICSGKNFEKINSLQYCDFLVDYQKAEEFQPATSPLSRHKFDAVYDTVSSPDPKDVAPGGLTYDKALLPFLGPQGKIGAINAPGVGAWFSFFTGLQGLFSSKYRLFMARPNSADLAEVIKLHQGKSVVIDSTHPFTEEGVYNAFDILKSRRAKGKVCVIVKNE